MRKLTLNLDDLQVESFATEASVPRRGTVLAQENATIGPHCTADETVMYGSCEVSCNYTACPADCQESYDCPIYSQEWTGCENCEPTWNEAVSCQIACS